MSKEGTIVGENPGSSSDSFDHDGDGAVSASIPEKYRGTAADRHDMRVLGRRQVLQRNFSGVTMLGFASMVMVAWEAVLFIAPYPLLDGGSACMFWGLIIAPICMTFVYLSLAELASM